MVAGFVDIVDDDEHPLDAAGHCLGDALADGDRARRTRRRQLDVADVLGRAGVVVATNPMPV
ncbi:hypothetical protein BJF84_18790 [Rhodococcus sp. CUA-806]|nr:hypothetical protein BJF84_18790 [Rhodococcus sp. CUA-806]